MHRATAVANARYVAVWIENAPGTDFLTRLRARRVYLPLSSGTEVTGEKGKRSRELSPVAAVRSNAKAGTATIGGQRRCRKAREAGGPRRKSRVARVLRPPEARADAKASADRRSGLTSPLVTLTAPRVESTPSCRASHPSRASVGVSRRETRRILGTRVREDVGRSQRALQGPSTTPASASETHGRPVGKPLRSPIGDRPRREQSRSTVCTRSAPQGTGMC